MAVIDVKVAATADDVVFYWDGSAWVILDGTGGEFVGWYSSAIAKQGCGMRFTGITIPDGATIITAYITFVASYSRSATTVNSRIIGEQTNNAGPFSTIVDYQSRRGTEVGGYDDNFITSARVDWDGIPAWTKDSSYNSPDIKTIIQELVDDYSGLSSANIVLFWDDHADRSTHTADCRRSGYNRNDSSTNCPNLHIEWRFDYEKSLSDTVAIADSISKSSRPTKSDTVAIADSISKSSRPTKSDTVAIADAFTKVSEFSRMFLDLVSIADSETKSIEPQIVDTVAIADAFTKVSEFNRSISDTITISDVLDYIKGRFLYFADTITISDTNVKEVGQFHTDTMAITDAFTKVSEFYRAFLDSITIVDTEAKSIEPSKVDTVAIADSLAKNFGLTVADSMVLADALSKSIGLVRVDTITIADLFSKASEFYLSLSDTVVIADAFSKVSEFYRSISDTIAITDSTGKSIEISKADLITISDAISKAIRLAKADSLSITEAEIKTIGKNLSDIIIISDGEIPIGIIFVPPGIYTIEVHETDGTLVCILEKAYNISLDEKVNSPKVVNFSLPADDSKLSELTRAREVWVRDYNNNVVLGKFKLLRKEDARD